MNKKTTIIYLLKVNISQKGENLIYGIIAINEDKKDIYFNKSKLESLKLILSESKYKIIESINKFIESEQFNPSDVYKFNKNGIMEFVRINMDRKYSIDEIIKIYQ